jgi:competence protein ComEC
MTVERDIAGIAFPFAAGVTAAVFYWGSTASINPVFHCLSLSAAFLSIGILFLSHKQRQSSRQQWLIIWICLLSCGIFTGLNGLELQISELDSDPLSDMAEKWGIGMGKAIDRIPFKRHETGSIIKALLTGDRESLSPETIRIFRDSGASHILALSGLHLGIIYAVISRTLALACNSRKLRIFRSILTVALCGIYTLATGAGASITRAFIFIAIKEVAEMTGRHSSLREVLAVSLMLHLTFAPTAITDIGFQLSYAAIFGIAYIYPHLKSIWRNNWTGLKKIWDSASLSISCQLTTGPLAYHYFGTFPQYFLLTNLLAIPLAGLLIPMALLTVIMSIAGCCPEMLIGLAEWITTATTHALSIIASM